MSCSPHWNFAVYSAFAASTSHFSLLVSRFLVCLQACSWFWPYYPLPPLEFQLPLLLWMPGFSSWLTGLSLYSAYTITDLSLYSVCSVCHILVDRFAPRSFKVCIPEERIFLLPLLLQSCWLPSLSASCLLLSHYFSSISSFQPPIFLLLSSFSFAKPLRPVALQDVFMFFLE